MALDLGTRIARFRTEKGLSQEALANELGISRQAVSRWERGEALPDTENLIALAGLFGVTLDELVREPTQEPAIAETVIEEMPLNPMPAPDAPPPPPIPSDDSPRWTAGRALILMGAILIFLGCLGTLANRLSKPHPEVTFESALKEPGTHADIDGQSVRNLSISYPAGHVFLERSDSDDLGSSIRIFQLSNETGQVIELPTWNFENGMLRIKGPTYRNADDVQLYVYIPSSIMPSLEDVELEIGSGVLMSQGISCSNLRVSVASGSAYLHETTTDRLDLTCASGYALLGPSPERSARELAINIASGSCDIVVEDARFMPSSIEANVASGELTFTFPEDSGFTIETRARAESISLEFSSMWSDGTIVCGSGETRIELSVASGTVVFMPE